MSTDVYTTTLATQVITVPVSANFGDVILAAALLSALAVLVLTHLTRFAYNYGRNR